MRGRDRGEPAPVKSAAQAVGQQRCEITLAERKGLTGEVRLVPLCVANGTVHDPLITHGSESESASRSVVIQ